MLKPLIFAVKVLRYYYMPNIWKCYKFLRKIARFNAIFRSSRSSDPVHHYHADVQHQRDVQLSKDGWRPMFPHPVSPPQQQQQQQMDYSVAKSGAASVNNAKAEDFVSYDYGSSDDDASVVVRPYEVPNQVNKN
jgi:hypothetical protein